MNHVNSKDEVIEAFRVFDQAGKFFFALLITVRGLLWFIFFGGARSHSAGRRRGGRFKSNSF
jgi:hypothetical protein